MTDATLQAFRDISDAMQGPAARDWEWIGPHMSQRMFGITQVRAQEYARRHGGTARRMEATVCLAGNAGTEFRDTDGLLKRKILFE